MNGFLREKDILQPGILPISRSSFRRMIARKEFPKPLKISERMSAWPAATVAKALEELAARAEGREQETGAERPAK